MHTCLCSSEVQAAPSDVKMDVFLLWSGVEWSLNSFTVRNTVAEQLRLLPIGHLSPAPG